LKCQNNFQLFTKKRLLFDHFGFASRPTGCDLQHGDWLKKIEKKCRNAPEIPSMTIKTKVTVESLLK
jgi:hypothetical protein